MIWGAVWANFVENESGVSGIITNFFKNYGAAEAGGSFMRSVLKYGKYVAVFWLLGIFPPGILGIFTLLLIKGAGYGFTTALFTKEWGGAGVMKAVVSYLPQAFVLVPAYFFIALSASQFALEKYYDKTARQKKYKDQRNLREYFFPLFISMLFVIGAALIENSVLPFLFRLFQA